MCAGITAINSAIIIIAAILRVDGISINIAHAISKDPAIIFKRKCAGK